MKKWILLLAAPLLIIGCSSIAVFSDFDSAVDFSQYITYAYLKKDIDAVSISDLDKRRILRSIDANLDTKGLSKSESPDHFFVDFFACHRCPDTGWQQPNQGCQKQGW